MKSKLVAIMHSVLSAYSSALRIVYFNVFLMNEEISMYMIPCLFFTVKLQQSQKEKNKPEMRFVHKKTRENNAKLHASFDYIVPRKDNYHRYILYVKKYLVNCYIIA